jgi:formylglycine-generating enzyme required for sulfatase activity
MRARTSAFIEPKGLRSSAGTRQEASSTKLVSPCELEKTARVKVTSRPSRVFLLGSGEHLVALGILLAGCGANGARPQLLVIVDTNAPVVGQLASSPELSGDSAIDTLRVDALDDHNALVDSQTFVRPDVLDWPISFGVASEGSVRLRLVAYRGLFARGADAPREMAIDRFVEITPADEGIRQVVVLLDAACRGTPSSFVMPPTTCVDGDHLEAAATEGVASVQEAPPTRVGSWERAHEVPCRKESVPGARCIPGGFSALGDSQIVDLTEEPERLLPLRPVLLSPFWMDEREFTVGRYRAFVAAGKVKAQRALLKDVQSGYTWCNWLGAESSANDAYALNCVTWEAAREACSLSGGRLPTEAEWEHAGRGRGQRRLYPSGDSIECCAASVGRGTNDPLSPAACPGVGEEPVGSHLGSSACAGDVSRDGIADMAGSLEEFTSDEFAPYSESCWQAEALLENPRCEGVSGEHAKRGGNWTGSLSAARLPLRSRGYVLSPDVGFRCVYDDVP